jgi:hypothetical protein
MTNPTDDEIDPKKRKDGETEGKGGRAGGTGRAGGGAAGGVIDNRGIAFSIDATRLKEIMANWRRLDMGEAVSAVTEFFGEGLARASANMVVKFDSATKAGFAIMTKFVSFGQDMAGAMRTRSREATAVIRRKYGINIKMKRGGQTIIAPNPAVS